MNFNINNEVRIKLTARGRELHKANFYKLFGDKASIPYLSVNEDAEGWSTWQLWSLMAEFGPHLSNGCDVPFETDIEILDAPA